MDITSMTAVEIGKKIKAKEITAQLYGAIDHILDTGCAVEHGENSVIVQMDECHVMSSDAGSCSD